MTWLAWRQLRANAVFVVAATVAIVVVLLVTRDHIADAIATDGLSTFDDTLQLLGTALIGLPVFIGAFWGAPLVARELETGTHRLAWTQSISRSRWLAAKLAVGAIVAVVVTAVFSAAFTWWSLPLDATGNRIGTANFGQRGIAPVAYALFALALGTLAGAIIRRTLPAMAATAAGFFAVRYIFQLAVRPRLLDPTTVTLPTNLFGPRANPNGGGWILSTGTVDGTGHVIPRSQLDNMLANACHLSRDSAEREYIRCADRLGIHDIVRMHPADHFWPIQLRESAIFLTLAFALTVLCFWWLNHRTT